MREIEEASEWRTKVLRYIYVVAMPSGSLQLSLRVIQESLFSEINKNEKEKSIRK